MDVQKVKSNMSEELKAKVNSFCASQSLLKSSSSRTLTFGEKYAEIDQARRSEPEFKAIEEIPIDKYVNLSISDSNCEDDAE